MDNPKFMTLPELVALYTKAKNNRNELRLSTRCGCFYCQSIFDPSEIHDWIDNGQTALCPYCSMDSVITKTKAFPVVPEVLEVLYKYYFEPANR